LGIEPGLAGGAHERVEPARLVSGGAAALGGQGEVLAALIRAGRGSRGCDQPIIRKSLQDLI
jgi:hypothetical protein